ncbi:MAG: phasin [Pseudolabrys sp.]|nr:phasin [Pseudolabrys sp.]
MVEDAMTATTPKSEPGALAPVFEFPKFEIPKIEMPKMEIPAAFREWAEKGIAQAKENYEKWRSAAEEATDRLEQAYAAAAKGCSGYGLKVIEAARANSDAAFELMTELLTAKSYAEMIELSSSYVRKQFDMLTAQAKELGEYAQKVASECAEPVREGFAAATKKAA